VNPVGSAPANVAPTAAYAWTANDLAAAFDGSESSDADGTITGLAWDFGDGTTGTGMTPAHTYTVAGTYPVRLTVTDNAGATGSVTHQVTVTSPASPPPVTQPTAFASDAFGRTVAGGLGTADVGGPWTSSAGASRQSVTSGVATFALAKGTNTGSYLGSVTQTSADVQTAFSLSGVPTGGGAAVYVTVRRVSDTLAYQGRVRVLADGSVHLALDRLPGTTNEVVIGSEVTVPGLTYTPGTVLNVRVQASGTGTTQLSASVWVAGSAEPATPMVTGTDITAELQVAGGVGLLAYLSGSATAPVDLRFTGITARPVA
jgi:PKD repeat protein